MDEKKAFFALLKAGLWEKEVRLKAYEEVDLAEVFRLAEEQSVVGLVVAGIERLVDFRPTKSDVLPFLAYVLQLEKRNSDMNRFISELQVQFNNADIQAVLVKGQGIAQCYEKPLWRTPGDIDLLLDYNNYEKAKSFLIPKAFKIDPEHKHFKHFSLSINDWELELHGTLHTRLSKKIDRELDRLQSLVLEQKNLRLCKLNGVNIYLPSHDIDIIFVFTHILHHYFIEGVGLRQICDWCRLLWTYRSEIDVDLLTARLIKIGLVSEWKAFASYAVDYLGMPQEAMPLYDKSKCWIKKAKKINEYVMEVGNFGHNRNREQNDNILIRKIQSAYRKCFDFVRHARVFPLDSFRFFLHFCVDAVRNRIYTTQAY